MIGKFWRENIYAAGLVTLIRLYLGWQWMHGGWEKITGGSFDASGFLKNAIAKPVLESGTQTKLYPTYVSFLDNFALPNSGIFKVLIPWGEFLVGLGLILGCLTTVAMFFGLMMNFMFMFAGTVSSNPWYLLLGFIIITAGANAGKFGADFYVQPYLRKLLKIKSPADRKQPTHV
jgi:thiosulfate dehydrogenase (quinone) large subunit